ncbi:hypothetical protein KRX51_08235 [Corynebacterium sp. TAE3-ERU12]|uniref:type II restriction enzyme n=1 Tax=Corynebacterium sp. TAE3-ERU12 TaxID=2849491 RepID=UPI001C48B1C9|nr:hypothetical protein [Corynebacterium sp. TAE3-ERU12]MBV7295895.1 hypothetical protein [Corynebacterium sp. TAE3-ERU12]
MLNDDAWQRVCDALDLPGRTAGGSLATVTADELKRYGHREPRLMAKIDHRGQLPAPFVEHKWGILPVARGRYVIGHFEMFSTMPAPAGPAQALPDISALETVSARSGLGETAALFVLHSSGALAQFAQEENATVTFFGRRGSGDFDFTIGSKTDISVSGAQMEIDAVVECPESILLIEAKREGDGTFVTRQLYYPYRALSAQYRKPIRPMYLIVGDSSLRLVEFEFTDPHDYGSIRELRQSRYVFTSWRDTSLTELAAGQPARRPPDLPFPQADSIDRLIRIVTAGTTDSDLLYEEQAFVPRQSAYYLNAARYLGFLDGDRLTDVGRELIDLPAPRRSLVVAKQILALTPFRRALAGVDPETVVAEAAPGLSGNTIRRRARTVQAWMDWLHEQEAASYALDVGPELC